MEDSLKTGESNVTLSIVLANTNEKHFTLPMLESVYRTVVKRPPL